MSGAASVQQRDVNEEDAVYNEIEEDSRKANGLIYNTIYEAGEKFAGTYVGQYATGKVDRLLKLIEDTAKWSLPQSNEKNQSKEPLERPLPWIPFIAMILILRFVRLSISIAGLLIGNSPILPTDVVYFIQTRRRKLRAIRITGMRDIRKKEHAGGQKSVGLVSKLASMLSVAVCKPASHATKSLENQNTQEGAYNNKINENDFKEKSLSCKRKAADESCSDQDLTLDQIIDKYGNASSDDDSDFNPPQNILNKDNNSSESTSSATSDDNDDDEDEEIQHTNETTNLKLETNLNNGNKQHQSSSNATENQSVGNDMGIKENGQRVDQQPHKPVPMPKPQKQAPVPIPIHEIKQEPTESDEERQGSQHQSSEESKNSPKLMDLEEKSVVALNDRCIKTYDVPQDQCLKHDQMENINGDRNSQIDHKSEVFLTPATSNEDLFFSPVGSPNLSSNFGFHPTSILKNPNAVYLERRGPEVVYQEQHIGKQELANETPITPRPESTPQQNIRGGNCHSGRPNKNKLRGKRR